ncbi:MAG: flagellar hook-basal body protein [Bacillota bacterium]
MIYGLYLSATGVLTNSYRQDVIANNLANAETVGFKRDLALFQEQRTEAQRRGLNPATCSNPLLEGLGGGLRVRPTYVDNTPGEMEQTGNPLDVAIQGSGYFAVNDQGQTLLTRDGRFLIGRDGYLAMASGGQHVLDSAGKPIPLDPNLQASINQDGTITQNGQPVGRIGVYGVPEGTQLTKRGRSMLAGPDAKQLQALPGNLRSEFVERANVESSTELVALLDAQRQLEANANMIRYQDQTLSRLVNDVAKIG